MSENNALVSLVSQELPDRSEPLVEAVGNSGRGIDNFVPRWWAALGVCGRR